MTEPNEVAEAAEPVVDGVWHWRIRNHAIGGAISSSQAVAGADGELVLIDPVRLAPEAMAALPRSNRDLPDRQVPPAGGVALPARLRRGGVGAGGHRADGRRARPPLPRRRHAPGGLRAVHTPGPEPVHYSFLLERGAGVFFCSDLLGNDPMRGLDFVPPEFHDDPAETRRSVERTARPAVRGALPRPRPAGGRRPQGRDPRPAPPRALNKWGQAPFIHAMKSASRSASRWRVGPAKGAPNVRASSPPLLLSCWQADMCRRSTGSCALEP